MNICSETSVSSSSFDFGPDIVANKMTVEILCATMVSGESKETLCFLRVEVIACVLWMWS